MYYELMRTYTHQYKLPQSTKFVLSLRKHKFDSCRGRHLESKTYAISALQQNLLGYVLATFAPERSTR